MEGRRKGEGRPGGKSENKGECPWAGSAEREKEGGHQGGGSTPAWETPGPGFPGHTFAALARQAAVPFFGGKPANQIGQQTGDLCGVGTAQVSRTVYPAVFFKTEISARVTTAVSYWLWLRGLGEAVPSTGLCSASAWKLLKECALPQPGSRWEGWPWAGPRWLSLSFRM